RQAQCGAAEGARRTRGPRAPGRAGPHRPGLDAGGTGDGHARAARALCCAVQAGRDQARAVMKRRIALIHAVSVAMQPIADAFRELGPEARCFNLLDDSLSFDRARAGELTPEISARIAALADYARARGADAILYTCSAFGPAIEAVARESDIPVLTPNE